MDQPINDPPRPEPSSLQQPPVPPQQPAPLEARETSSLAVAAMVTGIVAVVTMCFAIGIPIGLVALVLGIVALGRVSDAQHRLKGHGYAVAGIAMGGTALLLGLFTTAMMIGIMLPALGAARRTARQMQNNTQLRGVHQSFIMHAQGNGGHFPGLDRNGDPTDLTVEGRLQILFDASYFSGEYFVSPAESLTIAQPGTTLTPQHHSYALLEIADPGGRRDEWRETLNTDAVAVSDRNLTQGGAASAATSPQSVWTDAPGDWRGSVAWNDNHVAFEPTHVMPFTLYGPHQQQDDNLFAPTGPHDALMIHAGERQ